MVNPTGTAQSDVLLRLSVPPTGELRPLASEVAKKVAESLGASGPDAESLAGSLERAANGLPLGDDEGQIEFVFRKVGGELLIEARAGGRASEVRHSLPA
ncbi:MAG: hypothetical protein H0T05_02545 [Acidobacteria bacterium]|nr:hypothetical protein [Acidobacteriota bacterium]MBA3888582.1 hypothetical protein [Acidobacteriota bacterium]